MALPYPIAASQVDAKSPVDDQLMQAIKADLDDLDSRFLTTKTFDYEFKINGPLHNYPQNFRKRLDGALMPSAQTFSRCRVYLEKPGISGDLEIDIRNYKTPNTPILSLLRQYSQSISTIGNVTGASTQLISRATSQISTQSISLWKAQLNIESIVLLENNLVRYNLDSAPDSDWVVGDTVTFAGADDANNDGAFAIVRVNDDGYPCLVVTNASGVAQDTPNGTVQLEAWSYNYTNPVSSEFVAGEQAIFASHTTGGNNGTKTLYAVNSGGNNLVVKFVGTAQAGVAGNANVGRWVYTFLAPASATDFVVGESAKMSSHTNAANDGNFPITAVNSGGDNVVVYNPSGVAQGSAAGTVTTNRWVYSLPVDPSSSFTAGQSCVVSGATSSANDGTFVVKQVNRSGSNNIVVYNTSGVAQAGIAGTLAHSRMIASFAADQSSIYSTASRAEIKNMANSANNGSFDVVEVNRGGGANYNIVFESASGVEQAGAAGRVILESKSLFDTRPVLTLATSVTNVTERDMQFFETSSGDFNSTRKTVAEGDILAVELVEIPVGGASDVVVQLV